MTSNAEEINAEEEATNGELILQEENGVVIIDSGHDTQSAEPPPLSKKQRKRLARLEKKLTLRKTKRVQERARRRERKERLKAAAAASYINGASITPSVQKTPRLCSTMAHSKCKLRVAIDLAYEEHMDELTLKKTINQLNRCYAANRRAENPLQFFVVNMRGRTRNIFDKTPSNRKWDVFVMEERLADLWNKDEIVYLSAESDNVLTELSDEKIYVIGGLIDHNSKKGLCLSNAAQMGIQHARLPIQEFIELKTRKVLSINQVFEILLHFSSGKNWEKALLSVIPKRKGAEPLQRESSEREIEILEQPQPIT